MAVHTHLIGGVHCHGCITGGVYRSQLGHCVEVLAQHQQGDEALAARVAELCHPLVGMGDDGLGLVGVRRVVVEALLEVGKVGLHLDVVIVGLEPAFHKPRFTRGSRHHGNRVGRHHPLQVGGHVVALDGHDVAKLQVVAQRELGSPSSALQTIYFWSA